MRLVIKIVLILLLTACEDDDKEEILPKGFWRISQDGNSYFVLVDKEHWGDMILQRSVGMKVCKNTYRTSNYCEVYFFSNREDVPEKFPIMNRSDPMGVYAMKYGRRVDIPLPAHEDSEDKEGVVVFFKKMYKELIWNKSVRGH